MKQFYYKIYFLILCGFISTNLQSAGGRLYNKIPESMIIDGNIEALKEFSKKDNVGFDGIYTTYLTSTRPYVCVKHTALLLAIEHNKFDIAKFLLEKGANPNLAVDSLTPLLHAINKDSYNIQKLLLEHPKIKLDSPQLLFAACRKGLEDLVILLLNNGIDINAINNNGRTALFYAIEKNHLEIFKFLLRKGATVNIQDNLGDTPLTIALRHSRKEMTEQLLEYGAMTTTENINGESYINLIYSPYLYLFSGSSESLADVYKNHINSVKKIIGENINQVPLTLIDIVTNYMDRLSLEEYESIVQQQFCLLDDVLIKKKKIESKTYKRFVSFLNKYPQFINCSKYNSTMLSLLVGYARFDIIKDIFENPMIKNKPNLIKTDENSVNNAFKLVTSNKDKSNKIYERMSDYLKKEYNNQIRKKTELESTFLKNEK